MPDLSGLKISQSPSPQPSPTEGEGDVVLQSPSPSERDVAVVVDSAACVPDAFHEHPLAVTVPMRLHVGEATYRDGVDISSAEFYRVQQGHAGRTTTSAPTPGDFLNAFKTASETASSAVCVTVSEVFSSTRISAETAKAQLAEIDPDFEVRVVDSHSAAGGQGLVAWEALKTASGGGISEVESVALAVRERIHLLAYVDTLFYLWKSGRVPAIAHMGVSILKLKPLFELRMSEVIRLGRPRTTEQAMSRMADQMADRVGESRVHAIVMHAAAEERALELESLVRDRFDCSELFVSEFTPAMGAHIGPGMLGVAFWAEQV